MASEPVNEVIEMDDQSAGATPRASDGAAATSPVVIGSPASQHSTSWQHVGHHQWLPVIPAMPTLSPRPAPEADVELEAAAKRFRHDSGTVGAETLDEYKVVPQKCETFEEAVACAVQLAAEDDSNDVWEHPEYQGPTELEHSKVKAAHDDEVNK